MTSSNNIPSSKPQGGAPALPSPAITGLILAGGRGSRMGLVDKGLQTLHGHTLCQHVLARLAPQVQGIMINANQNLERYRSFGVPVVPDAIDGFAGPLAGMHSGMQHAHTAWLLSVPVDSPFLPPDLAHRLIAAAEAQNTDIAIAITREDGREQVQPVFCLMKTTLLPHLERYLAEGGRKIDAWYRDLPVARVLFADNQAFANLNTLEELQQAHKSPAPLACPAAPDSSPLADSAPAGPAPRNDGHTTLADSLAITPVTLANSITTGPATLAGLLGCLHDYDPASVPVTQAQDIITRFVQPIQAEEKVALHASLGRVLAQDILSPINVPAHDNSAMDGYALRHAGIGEGSVMVIVGTTFAGRTWEGSIGPGQCVRIMTGGVMPPDADTVIPQEFTRMAAAQADGVERVFIPAGKVAQGENKRHCGEDLQQGRPALCRGKILQPADLGLLASLGLVEVPVMRRLRVAFFSTGDELRPAGETLDAGCVYDSNRTTLHAMLTRLGCDLLDMGIIPDHPDALEAALRSACENADAIITSGGVSVGAADYTRQIMARLGEMAFWTIAMRPGRPMAFGRIHSRGHSAYLFGLPGNPVAVMVTFYFFARAALHHMMGARVPALPLLRARSQQNVRKKPGRTEYQRAILSMDEHGLPQVRITGAQGSGILRSMSEANCMMVLQHEQGNVAEGDQVAVLMFDGLI